MGRDFGIAVDCHGRLNLKGAIRLCRELEPMNLMFIEEPVPPENHDVLAEVNRSTTMPIAAGERWATIHGVRPFLEAQAVDILQCDLVNCGGITGLKKIAAMAEAHYVSMAPHNPNGPVATMMNLQFAACIPNYYQLETIGSDADWQSVARTARQRHPPGEWTAFPSRARPGTASNCMRRRSTGIPTSRRTAGGSSEDGMIKWCVCGVVRPPC